MHSEIYLKHEAIIKLDKVLKITKRKKLSKQNVAKASTRWFSLGKFLNIFKDQHEDGQ